MIVVDCLDWDPEGPSSWETQAHEFGSDVGGAIVERILAAADHADWMLDSATVTAMLAEALRGVATTVIDNITAGAL